MCGSTRALHALTHGRFGEAFTLNPLGAAVGLSAGLFIFYALLGRLTGMKSIPDITVCPKYFRVLFVLALVLVIFNWLYLVRAGR